MFCFIFIHQEGAHCSLASVSERDSVGASAFQTLSVSQQAHMSNVVESSHPLILHKITQMRKASHAHAYR